MISYFRKHPWQRRSLTLMAAILLGLLAATIALPYYQDYLLLRDMASADAGVRQKAIGRAAIRAKQRPSSLERFRKRLETADDTQFTSLVTLLRRVGSWDEQNEVPAVVDHVRAIQLAATPYAPTRAMIVRDAVLAGRDNVYIRRMLATAVKDPAPDIRELSAVLAAKRADDATLAALLKDEDAAVVAAAALDAGIAGRTGLKDQIRSLLEAPRPASTSTATTAATQPAPADGAVQIASCAAYGLALLAPKESSQLICCRLLAADDDRLRDRLLHVATLLDDGSARAAVKTIIASGLQLAPETAPATSPSTAPARAAKYPPAMAIIAGAKLKVDEVRPAVRAVLAGALARDQRLTISQVHAAVQAADMLNMPIRREAYRLCEMFWNADSDRAPLLTHAARLLAHQVTADQGDQADVPTKEQCIAVLQAAAIYQEENPAVPSTTAPTTTSAPATQPALRLSTALASAAAALGLWEAKAPMADVYMQFTWNSQDTIPPQYLAWHLSRISPNQPQFDLGLRLLPATGRPVIYDPDQWASGAMLLALTARTPQQKQTAVDRIESRLESASPRDENAYFLTGAYRCALLILGQNQRAKDVLDLLDLQTFPQGRALMALLCAGDKRGPDWLLWNSYNDTDRIITTLLMRQIGPVLSAVVPSLPGVDAAADYDLRAWQTSILRDTYVIKRDRLELKYP